MTGLEKRFPVRRGLLGWPLQTLNAVDGVDLEIRGGESLALVGESGSGKSTLARLVLQLIAPDAGSIELDGESILGLRGPRLLEVRRRMQMIFQDPYSSLDPTLEVRDILAEPLRVHRHGGVDDARLARLLTDVSLAADFLSRMPHELSGGQRQRVAIARALAIDPELIACDEIVSALDTSTRAQIINLLQSLQASRGLSLLFITHDLSIVPHVAKRVAVLYLGRIVEEGSVETVFAQPAHPYTQALIASIPVANPRAGRRSWELGRAVDVSGEGRPEGGCAYLPRCPRAVSRCRGEVPVLDAIDGRSVACHATLASR